MGYKTQTYRLIAYELVKSQGDGLYKPLVNQHTGASTTLGKFLMVLVLLKLWQKTKYESLRKQLAKTH